MKTPPQRAARLIATFASVVLGLATTEPADAATLAQQKAALDVIAAEADHFCVQVPLSQSSSGYQLSGDASARISGLAKHLADLGIGAAAKYSQGESKGVLQQHLATAIKSSNDCRLEVLRTLKGSMLPGIGPAPPRTPTPRPPGAPGSPASGPRLFVECIRSSASYRVPPSGNYYMLDLYPGNGISLATLTTKPGTDFPTPADYIALLRSMRCEVTNYGTTPLVDVNVPAVATFTAIIRKKIGTSDSVTSGGVEAQQKGNIHIAKIGIGDGDKFTFFTANLARNFVSLTFSSSATAQPIDRDRPVAIAVLQPQPLIHYDFIPVDDAKDSNPPARQTKATDEPAKGAQAKEVPAKLNEPPPGSPPMVGNTIIVPIASKEMLDRSRALGNAGDRVFDQLFAADNDAKVNIAIRAYEAWDRDNLDLIDDLIGRQYRNFYATYSYPFDFYSVPDMVRKLSTVVYYGRRNYLNEIRKRQAALGALFIPAPTAPSVK